MTTRSPRPRSWKQLLAVLLAAVTLLGCGGDGVTPTPPRATQTPSAKAAWTVLLYLDADDPDLEEDIWNDLNEAERVGSTPQVNIVAQMDRYAGGFDGDGDWSTARRFYVTQDDDLQRLRSKELADIGEVNMAEGATLADFVSWGIATYPAERYALILSDHGSGWPGGLSDADNEAPGPEGLALAEGFGDMIYTMELEDALQLAAQKTGVQKLDVIGFDACLMGQLEVFSAVAPYARYAVASEAVAPSLGFAYAALLGELTARPGMDGGTLARRIVETYVDQDLLVVDDAARTRYVERTYETDEEISAADLAAEEGKEITIAAIDLAAVPGVVSALDRLALALPGQDPKAIARTHAHALAFENVFEENSARARPDIDLGSWAGVLQEEIDNTAVVQAAAALQKAVDAAVVGERHGEDRSGATGISIYFPNAKLLDAADSSLASYTTVARTLAASSLWDDYLAYFYHGEPMPKAPATTRTPTAAGPANTTRTPQAAATRTPAATATPAGNAETPWSEEIAIAPLDLSAETATQSKPVHIRTQVTGHDIAAIYLYVGRYDDETGDVHSVYMDYVPAPGTQEIDDYVYPDYGDTGKVDVDVNWTPTLLALSAGSTAEPVFCWPEDYTLTTDERLYEVDGLYRSADSKKQRYAILVFSGDGKLEEALAYPGTEDSGPLREIHPRRGDEFTLVEEWIVLGENEDDEPYFEYREGRTFTVGARGLKLVEDEAQPGDYVVGILVEDLDGNIYEEYADVTVK